MNTQNSTSINIKALTPTGSREVVGVLLVGGDDTCLQVLDGKTLLEGAALNAAPQVSALVLNANGDTDRFPDLGLPVVKDSIDGGVGPLAGVLSAMDFAAQHVPQARWVATFAADAPIAPRNWVGRMLAAITREDAHMGAVSCEQNVHPTFGLWPVDLRFELRKAITLEQMRELHAWTARYKVATVDFGTGLIDPFFTINTPDDLDQAQTVLTRGKAS